MSDDILNSLESVISQYRNKKPPIAVVVRPDIYKQLHQHFFTVPSDNQLLKRINGLKVIPDPAANSVAMAQTEECMLFYDSKALTLYLNRGNEPLAWVRYCCECAGIPYPVDEKVSTMEKNQESDGQQG